MAISGDDFQEQVPVLVSHVCPNSLKWLYRFCNDICVHFISTGCSTLTRTRWVVACHTWTRTNHTWQNWVGISIFLIKMGEKSKKAFLKGRSRFFFPSSSSSFFSTRPAAQLFLGLKRLSASNGVLGSMKAWLLRDPFNTFGGYHRIRVEGHTHTHTPTNPMYVDRPRTENSDSREPIFITMENVLFSVPKWTSGSKDSSL